MPIKSLWPRSRQELAPVAGQGPEREIFVVAMVFQIKDPGKTGRVEVFIVPKTIFALGPEEIFDPTPNRFTLGFSSGHEGQERPGGLTGL